jgi:hypothetical protein
MSSSAMASPSTRERPIGRSHAPQFGQGSGGPPCAQAGHTQHPRGQSRPTGTSTPLEIVQYCATNAGEGQPACVAELFGGEALASSGFPLAFDLRRKVSFRDLRRCHFGTPIRLERVSCAGPSMYCNAAPRQSPSARLWHPGLRCRGLLANRYRAPRPGLLCPHRPPSGSSR